MLLVISLLAHHLFELLSGKLSVTIFVVAFKNRCHLQIRRHIISQRHRRVSSPHLFFCEFWSSAKHFSFAHKSIVVPWNMPSIIRVIKQLSYLSISLKAISALCSEFDPNLPWLDPKSSGLSANLHYRSLLLGIQHVYRKFA